MDLFLFEDNLKSIERLSFFTQVSFPPCKLSLSAQNLSLLKCQAYLSRHRAVLLYWNTRHSNLAHRLSQIVTSNQGRAMSASVFASMAALHAFIPLPRPSSTIIGLLYHRRPQIPSLHPSSPTRWCQIFYLQLVFRGRLSPHRLALPRNRGELGVPDDGV